VSLRDNTPVRPTNLMVEIEALVADPGDAGADLEQLAERASRAEVDLDAGDDDEESAQRVDTKHLAHVRDPRVLEVCEVDGVVHVPECVEVAERDLLCVHRAEAFHRSDGSVALSMSGELTRSAIHDQPEWLRGVPERVGDRRFPKGRVVFTGCGTSFHAAQTGGEAMDALEAVLRPPRADLLVVLSHEGGTRLAIEAAEAFNGPVWLVTGKEESPLAKLADELIVVTPAIEKSYCHTASYTCAVAALDVLRGKDVRWLRLAVDHALSDPFEGGDWERVVVIGAGRDCPTAQEAVLKLREGAYVAAEAHHTEQILHGHLAAIDETVRVFVLEGEGRAAERAADVVRALGEIGAETTLVPTAHPAVDIVRFQLLAVDLAQRRGVNPDKIRWDDPRWDAARKSYA
jgi:glucosamine--fructose-6-phosphate aminotransferase (isomerizing)